MMLEYFKYVLMPRSIPESIKGTKEFEHRDLVCPGCNYLISEGIRDGQKMLCEKCNLLMTRNCDTLEVNGKVSQFVIDIEERALKELQQNVKRRILH